MPDPAGAPPRTLPKNLLRELHDEGSTILMVTHDPRYSKYAQRTIRLFDGRVMDEEEAKELELA